MKLTFKLFCISLLFAFYGTNLAAQTLTVSGVVKSKSTSEPLPGATVSIVGTSTVLQTDANGKFSISAAKGSTLSFTYTGMQPYRYTVASAGNIEVILSDFANVMDEVVVLGYGTQKITKVSGAISTVKGEDIEKLRPVRAEDALQGRASGVTVISPGSPGAKPTVLIRGIPSYTGTDPVVIVDGSIQSLDDLNSINAADIESVNVLKDAATTAIYGV